MREQLASTDLVDCRGQVSHRLRLELDGTVTVTFLASGRCVHVDPGTRRVLTPGASLPEALLDQAASLRPW